MTKTKRVQPRNSRGVRSIFTRALTKGESKSTSGLPLLTFSKAGRIRASRFAAKKVAAVLALAMLPGFLVSAPALAASDGLTAVVTPGSFVRNGSLTAFKLAAIDSNDSGATFDSYLISGLPADWVVKIGTAALQPISPDPVLYRVPKADVQSGNISIVPPSGYVGKLTGLTLSREARSPNLVTELDGGTFDYIGEARPQLLATNTNYGYDNPTAFDTDPGGNQYGPWDGSYTIWPTADMNGPQKHYYNYWADLRSVDNPMSVDTRTVCGPMDGTDSTYQVDDATSASSGKLLVVNGAHDSDIPVPNNLVTTTVTGLLPNTYYSFSGYVANLSDNVKDTTVKPVQSAFFAGDTLIGSSQPAAKQASCYNDQTVWTHATSLVNTGSATSLTLGVRNYAAGGYGNDVGIDNLALYPMASAPFELEVLPALVPGLAVKKSADPATGTTVARGNEVTYTVLASNTGETPLENVTVTDNLADVFDDAVLVAGSPKATPSWSGSPAATDPSVTGNTLSWIGDIPVGGKVTLTYKVTVKSDSIAAATLLNKVTAKGNVPNGPEVPSNCVAGTEPDCTTTHPVPPLTPGLKVLKSADPATGTTVARGNTVTYTVLASNTGETPLTDVNVSDDLTDVLDDADIVSGSLSASSGAAPTVSGTKLSWTGDIGVGKSVTLTYKVKVKTDSIAAATLLNKVTGSGTAPGDTPVPSNCVAGTEPECTTTHPIPALTPGLKVLKSADPATGTTVKRGDTVTYTVLASNTGETPLTDVNVSDDLTDVLDDADIVSGSLSASSGATPTVSGNTLSWTGDIGVGKSVTLTYKVTVKANAANGATLLNKVVAAGEAPGNTDVPSNCVDGTEPDCTTTHPTPATSLKVEKTDNRTVVKAGESLTYDVTVTNTGADQVTGVKVNDLLPANLTYVSATDGGLYDPVLRFVAWDLGTLAEGESKTVHVTATVNLDVLPGEQVKNAAVVDSDQGCVDDPATPDVNECKTTDIDETPAVSIVKNDGKETVIPGQELTYGITASNTGTVPATDVTVTDQLPAELVFVSADQGGIYDSATGVVTWTIASLDPGTPVTVNVTATVAASVAPGTDIRNLATINDCIDDPATADVDECKPTDIDHTPAISIVKDDHETVVEPGDQLTYDLLVKNTSKYAAKDVVVTDVLPANLTFVSATDGGAYDSATRTVSWNLGEMGANTEQTVHVVVTVSADVLGNEVVSNTAKVTTENVCVDDPATDTNECDSTDIDRVPAVSITKDDGKTIVRSGETLDYVLTAKNTSEIDAPDVVVTDVLPENVEFVKSSVAGTQPAGKPLTWEWKLGTLKPGESREIIVTVKVKAGLPADTKISNTATITVENVCINDPATAVNECEATDTDETPSDVWILKDDHKTEVKAGEELTYDLTIGNNSTTKTITDAVVTDLLPVNAEFVSATDNGVASADGKSVTWKLAELAPGAKTVVKVTVKVGKTVQGGDKVINTASVEIPGGCIQEDGCTTTDIDGVPKLSIVKDDHKQSVKPGEQLTYDVTVTNETDVTAEKVVVSDKLPANVDFVSASDDGSYDQATRTVTWPIGTLAGNATKTVKVTVTVSASATGSVTNVAQVTTPVGCSVDDPCESTDVDTITSLATTGGAGFGVLGAAGVLLLAAGAALVAVRRRKASV